MAQTMVNFRMDEDLKKSMEHICKEMGLSLTAAFTIFAIKVTKEKKIPFELTAEGAGTLEAQRVSFAERFKDYKGGYNGEIIDWGGDAGDEICY